MFSSMFSVLFISSGFYGGFSCSLNIWCVIILFSIVVVVIVSSVDSSFSSLNFISIVLCSWEWVVFSVCSMVLL